MAQRLSFDTSFLIDLHREVAGEREGPAHDLLARRAESLVCISTVALGEFAEGFDDANDPALARFSAAVEILDIDPETALTYGRIVRELRKAGRLIGSNDLWIAASALRHETPLVTRNVRHFRRVPRLVVMDY